MRMKALLVVGFMIGYVMGARAGRARYDQIADLASRTWRSPQAREARASAAAKVSEAAPHIQHAVTDAGASAAHAMREKLPGGSKQTTAPYGTVTDQ